MSDDRQFRIMSPYPDTPHSIPWHKVAEFEESILAGHNQTIERLHERGGLTVYELYAHAHGWRDTIFNKKMVTDDQIKAWFKKWLGTDLTAKRSDRIDGSAGSRRLSPISDTGDAYLFNDELAISIAEWAEKHKDGSYNSFAGPYSVRIMAACQAFVDGKPLDECIKKLR